jgi:hypothetical protein
LWWSGTESTIIEPYRTSLGWWWVLNNWWNACPIATLATINPKWPDLGLSPGHCGAKLATNRLSYSMTIHFSII